MDTLSREATLPFSSLPPFSMGINSVKLRFWGSKVFSLKGDPILEVLPHQGKQTRITKVISLCQLAEKHGSAAIHLKDSCDSDGP